MCYTSICVVCVPYAGAAENTYLSVRAVLVVTVNSFSTTDRIGQTQWRDIAKYLYRSNFLSEWLNFCQINCIRRVNCTNRTLLLLSSRRYNAPMLTPHFKFLFSIFNYLFEIQQYTNVFAGFIR